MWTSTNCRPEYDEASPLRRVQPSGVDWQATRGIRLIPTIQSTEMVAPKPPFSSYAASQFHVDRRRTCGLQSSESTFTSR
jgi:hypothetical protein